MDDCVALARELGRRVGAELELPVYLYEHAALRAERRNLADVRRGGFEGLVTLVDTDPSRAPDFGPRRLHPTAGAVAIGARDILVAFNVHLGPAANLAVAREVAHAVRASSGGLPGVKALALEVDGQAQVSMNLVDLDATTMHDAFERVRVEAEARGVGVTWSEIVGLAPERALQGAAAHALRLDRFGPALVLEQRLREELGDGVGGPRWLERLAAPRPIPAAGGAAAHAGAVAAALAAMLAALSARPRGGALPDAAALERQALALRDELQRLAGHDEAAYGVVADLMRERRERRALQVAHDADAGALVPDDDESRALADALLAAARVPRDMARAAVAVAALALDLLHRGPRPAAADAYSAVAIADAACAAAVAIAEENLVALDDHAAHVDAAEVTALRDELLALAGRAAAARAESTTALAARRMRAAE
jgi:formiminotetrahydrofolate cyclodeaminase